MIATGSSNAVWWRAAPDPEDPEHGSRPEMMMYLLNVIDHKGVGFH